MEEVPFHVYAMKEPDYMMSLMSMGPINVVARRQLGSGWMGVETAKKSNSIILKWFGTTSCTATLLMITTINDTHLSVWRLFGQQSISQIKSLVSS